MAGITLFLDEDVRPLLAEILRQRGYDATHVLEANRAGKSDREQLAYAVSQGQAMLIHNIRDYLLLDRQYRDQGKEHCGIIVSDQVPPVRSAALSWRQVQDFVKSVAVLLGVERAGRLQPRPISRSAQAGYG